MTQKFSASETKKQAKPKAPALLDYEVLSDGPCNGKRARKGDVVTLSIYQAKYENVRRVKPSTSSAKASEKK